MSFEGVYGKYSAAGSKLMMCEERPIARQCSSIIPQNVDYDSIYEVYIDGATFPVPAGPSTKTAAPADIRKSCTYFAAANYFKLIL